MLQHASLVYALCSPEIREEQQPDLYKVKRAVERYVFIFFKADVLLHGLY